MTMTSAYPTAATAHSNTTTTSNETEGGSEESSLEDNPPPPRRKSNPRRGSLLRSSGTDWREKTSLSYSKRFTGQSTRRTAEIDDEEGKAQFFLTLLFQR